MKLKQQQDYGYALTLIKLLLGYILNVFIMLSKLMLYSSGQSQGQVIPLTFEDETRFGDTSKVIQNQGNNEVGVTRYLLENFFIGQYTSE